ncbi:MAG: kinase [Candidatus Methanoplasma sp.]|jgi:D-glycero-alpha-D-manno-heptose-7-phosphate kinase|nr:kinase [Candidatus Methanoplasma sp.]
MTEYVRARAPLRIGIAGGGTDVDPYASQKGGCVFNTTINKYAFCTIKPAETVRIVSNYFGTYEKPVGSVLEFNGKNDLEVVVANHFGSPVGFEMNIHSDVPAGSGLGGSSTMMVAMIAAMSKWVDRDMSPKDIARLAYTLEREELGLSGGRQDQYAAAYGGFNIMEFGAGDDARVRPVKMDPDVVNELQYRSILCYTGTSRKSAKIIDNQVARFKKGENEKALDESKRLALEISDAMGRGDIDFAGRLLDESWKFKKQFSTSVSNAKIDHLYSVAKRSGAIGGKVSGAGGGGFMYYLCEYDKKHAVAEALKKAKAKIVDFTFEPKGATAWRERHG